MKRSIILFSSLCVLCCSCGGPSEANASLSTKNKDTHDSGFSLNHADAEVLGRVSGKTLDKIRKGQSLEFSDVIYMQRSGIQPDMMMHILLFTQSRFTLTTAEIIQLQSEGVPFKVINFMIRT